MDWICRGTNDQPNVEPVSHTSVGASRRNGVSVAQGAALTIGAVLGTGVISLPSLAAGIAGPASLFAWLLMVLLSIPLAHTFAALGARYPDAGGVSTFVRRAFGDRAGTAVGWSFYFAVPVGAPPAAMFAGGYVADTLGGGRATTIATAAVLIVGVAVMNAFGVRISGRVQLIFAAVLVALLVIAVIAALPKAHLQNLSPIAPHGWWAIVPAAAVLVWAFAGWEAVTSLSADYARPRQDIPRATAIAVLVVGVLYLAVVATSLLVLGPAAGRSGAPLADLLAAGLGRPARWITMVVAVLLTVGAMNAYFLGGSKLGAALGRDGSLPKWFAVTRREVPLRSLGIVAALALTTTAVAAIGRLDLSTLVLLATGAFTLIYLFGTAAAVRLLPRRSWAWRGAVMSLLFVVGLFAATGWHVLWALFIAGLAVVYELGRTRRTTAANAVIPAATAAERTAP